ncbi:MAG: hypothetical protein Q8K02_00600 [Flavobacterium sp.]|nr:hypothetical protein [Flavobacterium sp.]
MEFTIHPKKINMILANFHLYGIEGDIENLINNGIIERHAKGYLQTKFMIEDAESFFKEALKICGELLFPCFNCYRFCQLEDLYGDHYGYFLKQTTIGQLAGTRVGRCKKCAKKEVKNFNLPRRSSRKEGCPWDPRWQ